MLIFWSVLLVLRVLNVESLTLRSPHEFPSTAALIGHDDNIDQICNLQPFQNVAYFEPRREIPQRTQGCSVPFYGPQGHSQFPEEVHIVHVLEVERLIQTLSDKQQALVTITLTLDTASCKKTSLPVKQASTDVTNGVPKPGQDFTHEKREEGRAKRKSFPSILQTEDRSSNSSVVAAPIISTIKQGISENPTNPTIHESKRPLVLLLTSDLPVSWQIKAGVCWTQDMASKIQAVVEKDSSVESAMSLEIVPKTWTKRINRKSIQRYARRSYHGVASFTQIRASNSVRIIVGPLPITIAEKSKQLILRNRNKLNFCDFSSRENSKVVTAFLSVPSSAKSCFYGEAKPMMTSIIELQPFLLKDFIIPNTTHSGNNSSKNLPQVTIDLSESKSVGIGSHDKYSATDLDLKNVTIILKSQQHVKWILSSSVERCRVNVVVNEGDIVECHDNSCDNLNVSSLHLPQSRSDLLKNILRQFSLPVQYFWIDQATELTFVVDSFENLIQGNNKFQHDLLATNIHTSPWSITSGPSTDSILGDAEKFKHTLRIVESEMVTVCGTSMFEILLPASALIQLGVRALHLKDRSCQSMSNGTHFILRSQLKSCGSDIHTSGKDSVISNKVYVDFGSSEGSGMNGELLITSSKDVGNANFVHTIPILCEFKPALDEGFVRSIFNSKVDVASDEYEDVIVDDSSSNSGSSSIYQLELYSKDSSRASLLPIKYKSKIDINTRIYVQAWMDDAPSAQAVIESCWVSNLPHPAVWLPERKIILLGGMCPAEKGVQLEQQVSQTKAFVFSFQMLEEFTQVGQELYVHCQVGICLSSLKYTKGKPVLCVDPQNYCLHFNPLLPSMNMLSTAHQLITRGPILVSSSVGQSSSPTLEMKTNCTDSSIFSNSSNLSIGRTVAICVCSFIIGMGLTGTLWFIHNKTEPSHCTYHGREHSLGSQSAVMGSSLSPHSACSSTNSQSVIT